MGSLHHGGATWIVYPLLALGCFNPSGEPGSKLDAGDASATDVCTIHAADYDRSCVVDSDCTGVPEGNMCALGSCTNCVNAAVSGIVADRYHAALVAIAGTERLCPCPLPMPVRCVVGRCALVQSAFSDGGADATDAAPIGADASSGPDTGPCPNACDDSNPCTQDTCDLVLGCQHQPIPNGASCAAGVCCGGTCTDVANDSWNCGSCGVACQAPQLCVARRCATFECPPTQALCGSVCTSLATDRSNCGLCGNACPAGMGCGESVCLPFLSTGIDGPFAPTVDTVLAPGIHDYTTITIPAGIRVTTTGSGILELRATLAVEIAGTVDVSGGAGGTGATKTTRTAYGGGGGGATGNPLGIGLAPMASCTLPGVGGIEGPGSEGVLWDYWTRPPSLACPSWGGQFGGGTGGAPASGGGGGGGRAGGGGGVGYPEWSGGSGSMMEGAGGAGGFPDSHVVGGSGAYVAVGGGGGQAPDPYAAESGDKMDAYVCPYPNDGGQAGGGAIGPTAAADLAVASTFVPGSGGGGGAGAYGGFDGIDSPGGGGGGGGGAVRITSPLSIHIAGSVLANGGAGAGGAQKAGLGGGGSGGVIYLLAPKLTVTGTLSAVGGAGATGGVCSTKAGDGGLGRIRISTTASTCTLTGMIAPPPASACAAATAAGHPFIAAFPN